MKKLEFEISEEQIAAEIIDLHNRELGYRKISQIMSSKGYPMSKDTVFRIFRKYRSEEQDVEVEDKETQQLKIREVRSQNRLQILKRKKALRKHIVDLYVDEIMENYEKRKKIFSAKTCPALKFPFTFIEYPDKLHLFQPAQKHQNKISKKSLFHQKFVYNI